MRERRRKGGTYGDEKPKAWSHNMSLRLAARRLVMGSDIYIASEVAQSRIASRRSVS